MVASWLAVCATHRQGFAITFWDHGGYPGFSLFFKKFGFSLHADSVVLVDFLHVLRSIEVRFISAPNHFEKHFVSFATITASLTHPRNHEP